MKRVRTRINNIKDHLLTSILILSMFFSMSMIACSDDDEDKQPQIPDETPVEISDEIKSLIYFRGEENAPTVLINAQGGPDIEFNRETVDLILAKYNTTDILVVNVHQSQTRNPNALMNQELTLEQGVDFNNESIEILHRVVKYFKDQGRTVYVLGISFGGFVVQELIAKKGIEVADRYLIITSRLDINEEAWMGIAAGKIVLFEDGINPMVFERDEPSALDDNLDKLTAGLGRNRYTQLLSTVEDMSQLTYIYGETDIFVGRLTQDEVQFLESKNANVLSGSGGHDEPFVNFDVRGFSEAFGVELKSN